MQRLKVEFRRSGSAWQVVRADRAGALTREFPKRRDMPTKRDCRHLLGLIRTAWRRQQSVRVQ